MIKRCWRRYSCAILLLVLIGAAVCFTMSSRPRLGATVCNEVTIGITLTKVECLVGVPPGDYAGGNRSFDRIITRDRKTMTVLHLAKSRTYSLADFLGNTDEQFSAWWGRNRVLIVATDNHGVVTRVIQGQRTVPPADWLGRCTFWIDSWFGEQD